MNKRNLTLWLIAVSTVIVLFIVFHSLSDSEEPFVKNMLENVGVSMETPPKEISEKYAKKIIEMLISEEDLNKISLESKKESDVNAILFDYGDRGKSLSYQKYFGMNSSFNLLIDRPDGIKLRHKIEIGTDMKNWSLVRKETNYPEDKPFKRTYLLIQSKNYNNGEPKMVRIVGKAYFEGAIATFRLKGLSSESNIKNIEEVTWNISKRLESIYDQYIKNISEGELFKDDPILTRPDLPDPDVLD